MFFFQIFFQTYMCMEEWFLQHYGDRITASRFRQRFFRNIVKKQGLPNVVQKKIIRKVIWYRKKMKQAKNFKYLAGRDCSR